MALQGVLFVCFSLPHPLIFFWGTDLFSQARIPLGGAFSDERAYCSTILPTSFTLKLAPRCGSRCRSPGPPPKPLRTRPREAPEKSRGGARPPAASAAPQASSPPSPPPAAARGGLTRAGRARPPSPPPSPGGPPGLPSPRGGGGAASARTGVPCVPGCRHSRTLDPRRPTPRPPQLDSCGPHPSTWDGCGMRGAGCGASLPRPSGGRTPALGQRACDAHPSVHPGTFRFLFGRWLGYGWMPGAPSNRSGRGQRNGIIPLECRGGPPPEGGRALLREVAARAATRSYVQLRAAAALQLPT